MRDKQLMDIENKQQKLMTNTGSTSNHVSTDSEQEEEDFFS
jgi:hypothetical protein